MSELTNELGKAGILGSFSDSEAIVRLTIFLVSNKKNPFTFQFQVDDPTIYVLKEDEVSPETAHDDPTVVDVLKEDEDSPETAHDDPTVVYVLKEDEDSPETALEDKSIPCNLTVVDDLITEDNENKEVFICASKDIFDINHGAVLANAVDKLREDDERPETAPDDTPVAAGGLFKETNENVEVFICVSEDMFDTGVKAVPKNVVREVSVSKEGKYTTAEFVNVEHVDFLEGTMSET